MRHDGVRRILRTVDDLDLLGCFLCEAAAELDGREDARRLRRADAVDAREVRHRRVHDGSDATLLELAEHGFCEVQDRLLARPRMQQHGEEFCIAQGIRPIRDELLTRPLIPW